MVNKTTRLLIMLISIALLVEGWVFFSRPKIALNKDAFLEDAQLDKVTLVSPVIKDAASALGPDAEEALNLELLGTAISNIKDPIAFIKDLISQRQGIYRLGSVIRQAKVVKIDIGEVVLDRNGRKETLTLSKRAMTWARMNKENPAIVFASADQILVSKSGLLKASDNILNSLRTIKVKPYYQAKEVAGMTVEGIAEGSIIASAGIQNKDVIKAVNNQRIDGYQKALQVLNKVRNQTDIKVTLLRGSEVKTLSYRINN